MGGGIVLPVPPTGDAGTEFWIGAAKAAYVRGTTTVEQLEEDIEALLSGGGMPGHFLPRGLPPAIGKRENR